MGLQHIAPILNTNKDVCKQLVPRQGRHHAFTPSLLGSSQPLQLFVEEVGIENGWIWIFISVFISML